MQSLLKLKVFVAVEGLVYTLELTQEKNNVLSGEYNRDTSNVYWQAVICKTLVA